jgi:hypothetical protein
LSHSLRTEHVHQHDEPCSGEEQVRWVVLHLISPLSRPLHGQRLHLLQ